MKSAAGAALCALPLLASLCVSDTTSTLARLMITVGAWAAMAAIASGRLWAQAEPAHCLAASAFALPLHWVAQGLLRGDDPAAAWRALLETHGAHWFTNALIAMGMVIYTVIGVPFLIADITERPVWLQKLRAQPHVMRDWRATLPRLLMVAGGNTIAGGAIAMLLTSRFPEVNLLPQGALRPELPTHAQFVREYVLLVLFYEVVFYYSHSALHTKTLYASIHKVHHEWKTPTAMSATFAHPVEFLLSNFAPGYLGACLFQTHYLTMAFFMAEGLCATMWAHSGYELWPNAGAHDKHHQFFVGNYGHLGLCDWLHGTTRTDAPSKSKSNKAG